MHREKERKIMTDRLIIVRSTDLLACLQTDYLYLQFSSKTGKTVKELQHPFSLMQDTWHQLRAWSSRTGNDVSLCLVTTRKWSKFVKMTVTFRTCTESRRNEKKKRTKRRVRLQLQEKEWKEKGREHKYEEQEKAAEAWEKLNDGMLGFYLRADTTGSDGRSCRYEVTFFGRCSTTWGDRPSAERDSLQASYNADTIREEEKKGFIQALVLHVFFYCFTVTFCSLTSLFLPQLWLRMLCITNSTRSQKKTHFKNKSVSDIGCYSRQHRSQTNVLTVMSIKLCSHLNEEFLARVWLQQSWVYCNFCEICYQKKVIHKTMTNDFNVRERMWRNINTKYFLYTIFTCLHFWTSSFKVW